MLAGVRSVKKTVCHLLISVKVTSQLFIVFLSHQSIYKDEGAGLHGMH